MKQMVSIVQFKTYPYWYLAQNRALGTINGSKIAKFSMLFTTNGVSAFKFGNRHEKIAQKTSSFRKSQLMLSVTVFSIFLLLFMLLSSVLIIN